MTGDPHFTSIDAEFADGVQVKWDGSTTAYIVVPEKYYGHAKVFNHIPPTEENVIHSLI
ncbi:hypothetical protein B566_EDAN017404 [Ephemera danica]|nr:hypothetical protein B566_EDAN017404 [Ephemera danica]